MIGWYLDVLVSWLIRTVVQAVRTRQSVTWPIGKGTVSSTSSPSAIGGPVAEIGYTYIYKGEYYSGVHRKAFLSRDSATDYVNQFVLGAEIYLRINPAQPETSLFVK